MKVLLAVSGGIDSMYMLARSKELFPGSETAVAHCNFRLRGEESDGDEIFVRNRCREYGIECFVKRFDTEAYAKEKGISVEMAARDLRYGWFAELMSSGGFSAVAVAHNADDNAETLMLNLLRGTGSRGLRGMGERELPGGGRVLRPLLGVSRAEIAAWMEKHGVPHREDSTNAATLYRRNKLRHEVFPVFAEINPSFLRTFTADMRHFAQVDDIAEDYFRRAAASVTLPGPEKVISIPVLKGLDHKEYVLFRLLEPYGFDEAALDALCTLLDSGGTVSGKTFEAPRWKAVTGAGRIMILPRLAAEKGGTVRAAGPGDYRLGSRSFSVKIFDRSPGLQLQRPANQLIADAGKLPFPLVFRNWEDGDWIRPLGLGGRKKLSDLFTDLKWSLPEKEAAVILKHPDGRPGHAAALLGGRIDDSLKVTDSTERIVEITLQ